MSRMYAVLGSILLISSLLLTNSSSAQNADAGVGSRWNFGFNMGGMWQEKNAVDKNKAGVAGGFTFGRHYLYNSNSPFYLGLRFRYLAGVTYGQDYHRSYGLKNNNVLNGTGDPLLNYDSVPGYYFHNYRTSLSEMGIEMTLGLNKLRKKTGILLYVFGGVGFSSHLTKMNVSGALGAYDYSTVDTTSLAATKDDLNFLQDLSYETYAEGNTGGKVVYHFSGTYGIGFGKMLGKHVALGMEYKITQPLTGDYRIDGKNWDDKDNRLSGSPQYHYWGGYIKLFWGGGYVHTTPKDTHVVHHNNPPPPPPSGIPPQIIITEPGLNFTTPYDRVTIRGTVTNINYQSSIRVKVNGMTHTDFMWNSSTKGISINTPLRPGANLVEIRATNQWGADDESITINYQLPVPLRPAPVVNITIPGSGSYTTGSSMQNVVAQVLNIDNGSQIQVSVNYQPLSNFYYDIVSHQLSFTAVLNQGNNPVVISATNESGTGSASVVINYAPVSTGAKPIITILNPPVNPANSTMSIANVSAQVLNVSGSSAITVKVNNTNIPFQYSPANKSLQFQAPLMPGANTVLITATNQFGMDSKGITINYIELAPLQKPEVIFTNPAVDPFTTPMQSMMVTADIHHVNSSADVQVTFNGIPVNSFSYNPATDQFALQVNLVQGANVMVIGAVNNAGMDSKSTTIIYQPVQQTPKPIVTITNPAVNPYNTGVNTQPVSATILNITSQSQIAVDVNGMPTNNFTYNNNTKVMNMNVNLNNGSNVVIIKATNSAGFDAKSVTINYSQQLPKPVVTITIPNTNPFSTTNISPNISATVLNVAAASAINVTVNGSPYANFMYSAVTKILTMSPTLMPGANNITITATNASGSDTKSQVINILDQPKPELPVVTITTPASNPYASKDCKLNVVATITHIQGQNDISVTMNGNPFTAFSWNNATKTLTINTTQNVGNSYTFLITGTNQWGSDAKSVTINCPTTSNNPSPTPPPIVTITQPNPPLVNITGNCLVNISATIQNVSSPNEISVKRNGQPWTNYLWNPVLKTLTINAPMMNSGNYVFEIKATTSAGSDAKTVTYNCQDPPPPPPPPTPVPPTVTIISPNQSVVNYQGNNCNVNIVAMVTNATQNQISVTLNGNPFTNWTWNANSQHVNINLQNVTTPTNVFVITATTNAGTDSKTVTFNCQAPPPPPPPAQTPPSVTIISPNQNPVNYQGNNCNVNIVAKVMGATQSQINVTYNGNPFTNWTWNASSSHVNINLQNVTTASNVFVITATNTAGTASATQTFNCQSAPPPPPPSQTPPSVTIISPNQNPVNYQGNNCNVNIVAKVMGATQSQISVTYNGNPFTNWTWNANSSHVNINMQNVSSASNVFVITATNTAGTASATQTFNCQSTPPPPPPPSQNPPTVIIISPNQNPVNYQGNNCNINIVAKVTDAAQNEISVTYNGNPFTNWTWNANSSHVNINMQNVNTASNVFVITATTSAGTASATQTFNCQSAPPPPPPPTPNPPTVTIITPNQSVVNYQGNNCNINIVAKVTGITNQSEISILYNGNPFTNYTWNASSEHVTINMQNVSTASNIFVISANTTSGSASESVTFNCAPAPPPPPPPACQPVITVISPNQSTVTYNGNNCNLNVVAKITCITDPSQISVKWNGNPFTGYTWNPSSQHIHWNMQHVSPSNNVFVITATNSAGTASVTQTFICNTNNPNQPNQKPNITLITPATDPFNTTSNTMTVVVKIDGITGAGDVQVKVNNQVISGGSYNTGNQQFSIPVTLNSGNNTVQIKATNGQGPTTKNITITVGSNKTNEGKPEEKGGKPPVPNAPKPKKGVIEKDG